MAGKEVAPSWLAMTCCLPSLPVDGAYIRMCKQGALQFVFLKPILASLTLLLTWAGVYGDQEIKANKAYPYIAFVYNLSYSLALYSLLLFYLGAHDLLKPYKPLLKFVLVKSVIFLTFWQSILCATLVSKGTLEDGEDGRALQNVLICVEMIIAAAMMQFAFPHADYDDRRRGQARVHDQRQPRHLPQRRRQRHRASVRADVPRVRPARHRGRRAEEDSHEDARDDGRGDDRGEIAGGRLARSRGLRVSSDLSGSRFIAGTSATARGCSRTRDSKQRTARATWRTTSRTISAGTVGTTTTNAERGGRGAAKGNFTGTLDGGGDGDGSGTSAAWALGDAMAPLHAEGRAGAGTVYDAVVALAAPPEGSPSKPAARTQTQPPTRVHPRAMPAAMDPSRRYAPTSIAPLAPPPASPSDPRWYRRPRGGGPRLGSGVGGGSRGTTSGARARIRRTGTGTSPPGGVSVMERV